MKKIIGVLFFVLSISQALAAGEKLWLVNKDHSEINFSVDYMKISTLNGRFLDFMGKVAFDQNQKNIESVEVIIKAKSLFTGQSIRDGHLRKKDFFHVAKYPYIIFKSSDVKRAGLGYRAKGTLNLRGVEKPQQVIFSLSAMKKDTWNFDNRFVSFSASLNRKDFNMVWNKTLDGKSLLIDDLIKIQGVIQLQPNGMKTPSSKHMIPDNQSIRLREKVSRGEEGKEVLVSKHQYGDLMKDSPLVKDKDFSVISKEFEVGSEASGPHWPSLIFLGFLGLFASIYISIKFKFWVSLKMGPEFKELSLVGISSDLLCLLFVYLFALAFYQLGWGGA